LRSGFVGAETRLWGLGEGLRGVLKGFQRVGVAGSREGWGFAVFRCVVSGKCVGGAFGVLAGLLVFFDF